jgi:hypothetical protein
MTRFGYTMMTEQCRPDQLIDDVVRAEAAGFDGEDSVNYRRGGRRRQAAGRADGARVRHRPRGGGGPRPRLLPALRSL